MNIEWTNADALSCEQTTKIRYIVTYAHEAGLKIDADRFWNYYQSNGWMVGRNKMKDWKAAVRNWAAKENGTGTGTGTKPKAKSFDNFEARPAGDLFSQYINRLEEATG